MWNGIKTAIITPIEAARDKIRSALDAVSGFFSGLKLQLPHIKLPHFRVSGTLSISPPSVPHLSIDWYKEGGIMTKPTVFGMNGSALMAGGEAGSEAILPLSGFYKQLEAMLDSKLNMHNVEKYLAVIAANSGKDKRGLHAQSRLASGDSKLPDAAVAVQHDHGAWKEFSDTIHRGAGPCGLSAPVF